MATARELTLGIIGMTCGECRRSVEAALAAISGVHEVNVDLYRGMAEVRYEPGRASPGTLAAAVRRAGYEVEAPGHRDTRASGCGCTCGCGCG